MKSPEDIARELLTKLESFATSGQVSGTITADQNGMVAYTDSNLDAITTAIQAERDVQVSTNVCPRCDDANENGYVEYTDYQKVVEHNFNLRKENERLKHTIGAYKAYLSKPMDNHVELRTALAEAVDTLEMLDSYFLRRWL